jgi:hypothetical protein
MKVEKDPVWFKTITKDVVSKILILICWDLASQEEKRIIVCTLN